MKLTTCPPPRGPIQECPILPAAQIGPTTWESVTDSQGRPYERLTRRTPGGGRVILWLRPKERVER